MVVIVQYINPTRKILKFRTQFCLPKICQTLNVGRVTKMSEKKCGDKSITLIINDMLGP